MLRATESYSLPSHEEKAQNKSFKTPIKYTIKMTIYTYESSDEPLCCCSHLSTSSMTHIEHIPSSREYVTMVGHDVEQAMALRTLERRKEKEINKGSFESLPVIMAHENEEHNYDQFIREYPKRFNINFHWSPWNNCANSTNFAIDYFPREPKIEPKCRVALRCCSKATFGILGSCLGIRAFDTLPGMLSPVEVKRRAKAIQHDQQRFFSQAPKNKVMSDMPSQTIECQNPSKKTPI